MNLRELLSANDPDIQANKRLYEEGKATRVITGYETKSVGPDGSTRVPIYDYIPNETSASSGSSSNQTRPDQRSTGEYEDIINSLQIEQQAASNQAAELRAQDAEQFQTNFDELAAGFNSQIDQLNAGYSANITALNDRYNEQAAQFAQFTQLANAQLAAAQANYEEQRRMTANLQSAFVPEPNPSAFTASIGDQRAESTRRTRDNKLSDLTSLEIVSGLGTASNPLSGLQLA